jgi:hypothetical protein
MVKTLETPSRQALISFDDLVDFFYARRPWWCIYTRKNLATLIALSIKADCNIRVVESVDDLIDVIHFAVIGKFLSDNTVEIIMAAGDMRYAKIGLRIFLEKQPKVTKFVYKRKSNYIEKSISVEKLQKYL